MVSLVLCRTDLINFKSIDFIIPANEKDSVFIMTNFIKTEQTQSFCDEEIDKPDVICRNDNDCKNVGLKSNNWNGAPSGNKHFETNKFQRYLTHLLGKCVKSQYNSTLKVCEIYGWCPTGINFTQNKKNLFIEIKIFYYF